MEFLEIDQHFFKVIKEDGVPVRLDAYHFADNGQQCGGAVPLGDNEWQLYSEDPLDVRPSIDCDLCSSHYTVVRGRILDHRFPPPAWLTKEEAHLVGQQNTSLNQAQ